MKATPQRFEAGLKTQDVFENSRIRMFESSISDSCSGLADPCDGKAIAPADIRMLRISSVRRDERLQHRSTIDANVVREWAALMRCGTEFPTVTVWQDGEIYWLSDGFHRTAAAAKAGRQEVRAEIRVGTFADAQWESYAANSAHGLRRTRSETTAVICDALRHPNAINLSNVYISKFLHVPEATVRYWRGRLFLQANVRTVTRGSTTYQMDIKNLAERKSCEPKLKNRRDQASEISEMRAQASAPVKALLSIIEKWALGQLRPARCVEVLEKFVHHNLGGAIG